MDILFNKIKLISLVTIVFIGFSRCAKVEDSIPTKDKTDYVKLFTQEDIEAIKDWLMLQEENENTTIVENTFPRHIYSPSETDTDIGIISEYFNGILYLRDALLYDRDIAYNIDFFIKRVDGDNRLDKQAQLTIFGGLQLMEEVFNSIEFVDMRERTKDENLVIRANCDCSEWYDLFVMFDIYCQSYGNIFGHCDQADEYWSIYVACQNSEKICPPGFDYDGHNCWSHVWFPEGYHGFVYGNGFYTSQNCEISTANNCCPTQPSGFGYDGANCHYWGLYFPPSYEAFVYENGFFVKAKCDY